MEDDASEHEDDPLAHEEWKPLLDGTSKPFDQTDGATTSADEVPAEFDEKLFLLEKGVAGNIAAGFGSGSF